MIKVLFCKVGEAPEVIGIEDNLESLQSMVGGYIEGIKFSKSIYIYCNEDGIMLGLPRNRLSILGDFFFTKADSKGNLVSLSDQDIDYLVTLLTKVTT